MNNPLEKELKFYIDHQEEMVEKYDGKVIVIKNGEVLGEFDSELDAVTETQKSHPAGTFLVQRVSAGSDHTSQTFHSRVAFS